MKFLMSVPRLTNSQAEWDLGDRKSTGCEQFVSNTERGMLEFTLPIPEKEELKTIRLFLDKRQDFPTAVDYLSHNAGLRHLRLEVSTYLIDADAARNSRSIPRSQIARPKSAFSPEVLTQEPPRPRTTDPLPERVPSQGHLQGPSLSQVSQTTQGSFARDRFSQPRRSPSRNFSVVDTHNQRGGPHHGRLDDRSGNRTGQVSSSAGGTISMRAPLFEKHPSPRQTPEILPSRSPWISECGAPSKIQDPEPAGKSNYSDSSLQNSRPGLDNLDLSNPAHSKGPCFPADDELDQVPPPRQLPFSMATPFDRPRPSSSTVADQSPLGERPDLLNTSFGTRTNEQPVQPTSQNIGTKTATRKQPSSRQKRPPAVSRRAASSASGSKLDFESAPKQPAEPLTPARRSETSLGIHHKRKKPSSDAPVSGAMSPVMDSAQSGAKRSRQTPACVKCRIKKIRCDRAKPICGACLKDNGSCVYGDTKETAATGSTVDKANKSHRLETVVHPMGLRSQAVTSHPAMSDALTQSPSSWESRDTATQTQLVKHGKQDVDMVDVGTEPCSLYIDASTETDGCNDIWFPFSQCAEVMIWAGRRSEEQIEKAAEVLKTTDPSHEDYRSKVEQAAMYAVEFEKEIRDKCEEILRRG